MNFADLASEFPREAVHWRVQGQPYERNGTFSAMALAYIDARDVMDRFDEVCGPEGWQAKYEETPSGRVICSIGVQNGGGDWVWKSDGAGSTQVEGEKGGISDALKRAAVVWGVGRYLYRLDAPWVTCAVRHKGSKTYWKEWTQDPWSKVKKVGYTQPPKEPPAPKPEELRDRIKGAIGKLTHPEAVEKFWAQGNTKEAVASLPQPMQAELQKAYTDRLGEVTPNEEAA